MQLDIIIPLYKSKDGLNALISRLNDFTTCKKMPVNVCVIFVEDGSADGTFEALKELRSSMKFQHKAIQLVRNFGQHSAIAAGMRASSGDFIAVMDDDLQHDPLELDLLYDKLMSTNADLVYGEYADKQHHLFRNISSKVLKRITKSKQLDFSQVSSFKFMKRSVLEAVKIVESTVILVDVYLIDSASKIETCKVTHAQRAIGESTYSSRKLLKMTLQIILFHSSWPLKMIVRLGIGISIICFFMSAYYSYQKFVNDVPMGFTSLIVAIFLSTGLILISLGIIGEYIRQIWVNQNNLNKVLVGEIIE